MVIWESLLKVERWSSEYPRVDRFLKHYSQKVRSERTRKNCLYALSQFSRYTGNNPDELTALSPRAASNYIQRFLDDKREQGRSIRYVNVVGAYLNVHGAVARAAFPSLTATPKVERILKKRRNPEINGIHVNRMI